MRPLESGGAGALAQERGGTRANAEHEREWEVEGDGLGEGVLEVVDGGGGSLAGCCLDAMVEVVDALVGEARHPSCRHLVGVLVLLVLDTRRPSRLAIISPSFDGGAGLAEAEPAANHTPEHGQTLP